MLDTEAWPYDNLESTARGDCFGLRALPGADLACSTKHSSTFRALMRFIAQRPLAARRYAWVQHHHNELT